MIAHTASPAKVVQVALPLPARRLFDYRCADDELIPRVGVRVIVPLQRRSVIGIVCSVGDSSEVPVNRLRKLNSVLDEQPVFASPLLKLLLWTAHYYHHPVGEVLQAALPVALRQQQPLAPALSRHWRICADGERVRAELPARYVLQHQVLAALATAGDEGLAEEAIKILSGRLTPVLARLHEQGWIAPFVRPAVLPTGVRGRTVHLTVAQERACQGVIGALAGYAPFLLHGVTGSGKTEVYLRAAAATLAAAAGARRIIIACIIQRSAPHHTIII